MAVVKPPPVALSPDVLSVFYTTDELLSNTPILVFYGPSATTTVIPTNSRIQVHIYSPAGFQSYPRLTVSPNSPLYAAVTCLAREEQGDEICRGLAFGLFKYFAELPANVREEWDRQFNTMGKLPSAPKLFGEAHAAMVASRMAKVENVAEVISDVTEALAEQSLSWIDVDVVMPPGTMQSPSHHPRESDLFDIAEDDILNQRYGEYAPVIRLFGQSAFLPTSKLRRAPSKPTSLNRTLSFSRKQKENLRREMVELLDTEESYVSKLYDLIHSVAEDFREKACAKSEDSSSPSSEALKSLFPPSLDEILDVNTRFLEALRTVLDDTEDGAINDLETTADDPDQLAQATQTNRSDATGAEVLGKCLVEWFPKFADCYAHYIQAHADFARFLKIFMKETGSSFSKRVQDTGEQRLMSMLIEPVQRLPRYNLYIDNLVKQLPVRHPAIKPLLKARDIISEICSRDSQLTLRQMRVMDSIKRVTAGWPSGFQPQGRLITAVDVIELAPPYQPILNGPGTTPGILLLFSDALVMLQKPARSSITARGLLSDIESSKSPDSPASTPQLELIFYRHIRLADAFVTEIGASAMQLKWFDESTNATQRQRVRNVRIQRFHLFGAYEGKASKFSEDFVKARVEGRFSETEREGHRWEVRSVAGGLGLWSAIFEEGTCETIQGRREPAPIRIVVDPAKGSKVLQPGQEMVELAASLTILGGDFYGLEITGLHDYKTQDQLTAVEFLPVLAKRLSNYFQLQNQIKTPSLTASLILRNQQILKAINVRVEGQDSGLSSERGFRPASPVKILSSLFGGGSTKELGSPKKTPRPTSLLMEAPRLTPATSSRPGSRENEPLRPSSSKGTIGFNAAYSAIDSLVRLEETLATYILALHARKGNVVGRSIRGRAAADELAVNELYNALLEDPTNHQIAAQATVDVLFAAFEKFVKVAWTAKMDPVITQATFTAVQTKSDNAYPGDFEEFFRKVYGEMSPQNQRALQAIIRLLADLLDGTGNDSDRGILTAAFAEVLVQDGNPQDFISLLDRFVEDIDVLFIQRPPSSGFGSTPHGSLNSESRARATNTGSLNSSTSSFRKRLGFGTLSRENSKSEHESKLTSILRTLSKNSHSGESQPSSLSKGSLSRSKSTDIDVRLSPKRPGSRDRPTVLGAFSFEEDLSHSGFSYLKNSGLDTIGEVPGHAKLPPRKKRRSSLSDLKTLQQSSAGNTPTWSPHTPRNPAQRHQRQTSASPGTHIPPKPTAIPAPITTTASHIRTPSPVKKENLPPRGSQRGLGTLKSPTATTTKTASEEITITGYSPVKRRTRGNSASGIATLKSPPATPNGSSALSERLSSGNATKLPAATGAGPGKLASSSAASNTSPTRKLRMQSPQKLRERLQREQKAITTANSNLHTELTKIGEELTKLPAPNASAGATRSSRAQTLHSTSPTRRTPLPSTPQSSLTASISTAGLMAKLTALESQLVATLTSLQDSISHIEQDLSSSLQVSESKAKKLDELYREANAENEALYSKFNEELTRVMNKMRTGGGIEELKKQLRERGDEVGVLKREVARLKRENVGLRAQLRE